MTCCWGDVAASGQNFQKSILKQLSELSSWGSNEEQHIFFLSSSCGAKVTQCTHLCASGPHL